MDLLSFSIEKAKEGKIILKNIKFKIFLMSL
jgi:hypothetical protein